MINTKKRVDPTIALEGLCIIIKGKDKSELFNNSFRYPCISFILEKREKGLFQISPHLQIKLAHLNHQKKEDEEEQFFLPKLQALYLTFKILELNHHKYFSICQEILIT
jgi:hypothetical protein